MYHVTLDDLDIVDVKGVLYCRIDTGAGHRFVRLEEEDAETYRKHPYLQIEEEILVDMVLTLAASHPKTPRPFYYDKVKVALDEEDVIIYVVNNQMKIISDSSALSWYRISTPSRGYSK